MFPRISIVILNWNGWEDTIECLESLYQIIYPNYDVIVVDNGSKDNSVQKIKEYCKGKIRVDSKFFEYNPGNKPIYILEYTKEQAERGGDPKKERYFSKLPPNRKLRLILNEKNYGFAEGNNIAIRYVLKSIDPDYVLLLNNDTVVDKRFLNELVRVAESDKKIGIIGPKIYYYDYNGRSDVINFAGGKLSMWKGRTYHIGTDEIDNGQYDIIRIVDYIEGSCLLIKKEILNKINLFDSSYFAYWEENDLCMRVSRAGYNIVYVPTSKIWHKVSSSAGNIKKIYYLTRNRFWFMKKHASKLQLIIFLLYFFGFRFWVTGFFIIRWANLAGFISFCKGLIDGMIYGN